jgi:hypothetical protein
MRKTSLHISGNRGILILCRLERTGIRQSIMVFGLEFPDLSVTRELTK